MMNTFRRLGIIAACIFTLFLSGCSGKYVTVGNPKSGFHNESIGMQVASTASSQVGRPYRLGGTSPQGGFDCSGLIFWAYLQNGIEVPRVTVAQANEGYSIARNQMRPGDILVFRSKAAPNGLHTGMYLGSNTFVHSPNARSNVKREQLYGAYWGQYLLRVKRFK